MSQTKVPQWNILEKSYTTSKQYTNPFTDVRLSVCFTYNSTSYNVDGFYDGIDQQDKNKHIWRFRFAPMKQGQWEFETTSNDPELNGLKEDFLCTEPESSGGLTVNHQFPNWLFREDGKAQFILNDGWTPHPGSKYGIEKYGAQVFSYPTEKKFQTFIKRISKHRVNMTIDLKQLYARQKTCTDPSFLWPWKVIDPETHKIDKEMFSLEYFQRLDRQVQFAKEHNVFYGVEVLYDNSTFRKQEWANHPYNETNGGWIKDWDAPTDEYTTDQLPFGWGLREILNLENKTHMKYLTRMVKYLVARTSAYWNVFYAMGCETTNIYPGLSELAFNWYDWWGDFMSSKDPYGRLLTIGDVAPQSYGMDHKMDKNTAFTYGNPRNNIITTQEHTYTDDINDYSDSIYKMGICFWKYRKPMVVGEQDGRNNKKYEKERRGFWAAFLAGFTMGRIDRHYEIADVDKLRESTLFGLKDDPDIYKYMENLYKFIDKGKVSFWRMKPLPKTLITADRSIYCLGEEGKEYIIYFATGGTAEVQLPNGNYEYCWFDPKEGIFKDKSNCLKGLNKFTAPNTQDWTIIIRKTGEL